MAGKRMPTEVVEARGRKHLTKKETAERKESEVRSDGSIKRLQSPSWLDKDLRPEFNAIAKELLDLMPTMVIRSDAETIAAWVMVHHQWIETSKNVSECLRQHEGADITGKYVSAQGKLFSQARALAQDLGLTISSRCELVVPKAPEQAEDNPILQLLQGAGKKAGNG